VNLTGRGKAAAAHTALRKKNSDDTSQFSEVKRPAASGVSIACTPDCAADSGAAAAAAVASKKKREGGNDRLIGPHALFEVLKVGRRHQLTANESR